ncbi:hypothetical protein IQ268_15130 [Oculatella sp. LEGE 06141]|uniref:hypothetical protein n=1 Tax=Oculatella sp. LEGE 06141 TaxID=1828648 RepID=UPI00187EA73A|nr:hypothetical protein [Oculatella sp. LEGE 06141]MBE9179903.1 hypothetical protein [Oculatella sp. LEGE 06141]
MLKRSRMLVLSILAATITGQTIAHAQTELRRGVVQYIQLQEFANQGSTTLSRGMLADLQADPYFSGDFQTVFNTASTILQNYTVVNRGGYFPENAGIPREQQLTRAEAVYRVLTLASGNELVLYRSPALNTAEYFIRTPSDSF